MMALHDMDERIDLHSFGQLHGGTGDQLFQIHPTAAFHDRPLREASSSRAPIKAAPDHISEPSINPLHHRGLSTHG